MQLSNLSITAICVNGNEKFEAAAIGQFRFGR